LVYKIINPPQKHAASIMLQATCLDCKFVKNVAPNWGDPWLTLADPTTSISMIFPAAAMPPTTNIKPRMAPIEVNESQFPESQLGTVSNKELSVILPAAAMPSRTSIKAQFARIEVTESQFPESQLATVSHEELSVIFPAAAMPPLTSINFTRPALFSTAPHARPAVTGANESQLPVCQLDTVTHKELTAIYDEDAIPSSAEFQSLIASPRVTTERTDDELSKTCSKPDLDNQPVKQLPTPVVSQIITKRKCPAEPDMAHSHEDITHEVSQLHQTLSFFV
jgi:hypothetical protein